LCRWQLPAPSLRAPPLRCALHTCGSGCGSSGGCRYQRLLHHCRPQHVGALAARRRARRSAHSWAGRTRSSRLYARARRPGASGGRGACSVSAVSSMYCSIRLIEAGGARVPSHDRGAAVHMKLGEQAKETCPHGTEPIMRRSAAHGCERGASRCLTVTAAAPPAASAASRRMVSAHRPRMRVTGSLRACGARDSLSVLLRRGVASEPTLSSSAADAAQGCTAAGRCAGRARGAPRRSCRCRCGTLARRRGRCGPQRGGGTHCRDRRQRHRARCVAVHVGAAWRRRHVGCTDAGWRGDCWRFPHARKSPLCQASGQCGAWRAGPSAAFQSHFYPGCRSKSWSTAGCSCGTARRSGRCVAPPSLLAGLLSCGHGRAVCGRSRPAGPG